MRVLVLALVFSVNIAFAEVQKLDKEDFSANGMELRPSLADGADACSAFSRYGVFLSSYPYGAPVARIWVDPIAVLPKMYPVVTNEAEEQLDSVLVIDFRPPVQKVGLTLNADPAQGVSIQAIGAGGEFLGELSATAGPFGTFVGLEDVDVEPATGEDALGNGDEPRDVGAEGAG